jgi:hypothetical protein
MDDLLNFLERHGFPAWVIAAALAVSWFMDRFKLFPFGGKKSERELLSGDQEIFRKSLMDRLKTVEDRCDSAEERCDLAERKLAACEAGHATCMAANAALTARVEQIAHAASVHGLDVAFAMGPVAPLPAHLHDDLRDDTHK